MYSVAKANDFIEKHKNQMNQTYRQKIHLQLPVGWMNALNGFMVKDNVCKDFLSRTTDPFSG